MSRFAQQFVEMVQSTDFNHGPRTITVTNVEMPSFEEQWEIEDWLEQNGYTYQFTSTSAESFGLVNISKKS